MRFPRITPRYFCIPLLALLIASRVSAQDSPEGIAFFEKKIRPILVSQCYECHSAAAKKTKGGLALDTRDGMRKGGDKAVIVVGEPEKSLLIKAVRHGDEELKMPPKQKLADAEIADLGAWIKMGAPDPRTSVASGPLRGMTVEEGRAFWSFQPLKDSAPPAVKDAAWATNAIDRFILARIEAAGARPAPIADKRILLRRVTFDLTGLPPTPGEVDAFLSDSSPQAFEKVVDRLLASPRYGERWGRHWLDVARYADTSGNASDYPVPQAYRYRDWVIRAFNRDMPYDQFLREQIAGDLMPSANNEERADRIVATGYLASSRRFGGDRNGEHHLTLEDTIDNVGRTILGFSLSCARCHDHKFDPFTMTDYYGLYGIFSSSRFAFPGAEAAKKQEDFVPLLTPAEIEALQKPHREKLALADAEMKKREVAEAEAKKAPDGPEKKAKLDEAAKQLAEARKARAAIAAQAPAIETAYAVTEGKVANVKMHLRGDPKRPGDEAPRRFPTILGGNMVPKETTASGRLELAQWLTDPKNPLPARVMANRIWQHHFGKGIVQTPNDFGKQGKAPTHPELLDYLAVRFIESGWSIKAMHKLILLSKTWQSASIDVEESTKADPTNELSWKFNRRRLDAESLRDALLFVSGELDETPAGPHPFPPAQGFAYTQHNPFVATYETKRRSVYLMQQRLRKHPYLALFDGADPSSSTAVRLPSTTPLQALFLMNDPFAHHSATKFAQRIVATAKSDEERVVLAHQIALSRPPASEEKQECLSFLDRYRERLTTLQTPRDQADLQAWSAFARAMLGSNEFLFTD
ncbi:MAG: DUF1553 domain-containing protein [Gemmataceae bacterium]|nr:DUF1553 domain-containing protein [Gemmataceae bacterium]